MSRQVDPRSNPIIGSEVISGQITDKALALFNLLNQVTGSEGDNVRTFNLEGISDPLTLALYSLEPDDTSHAWSPRQRIYFQDNGQRLRDLQTKLRTNFDRIKNDISSNVHLLFDLISKPETDVDGDGNPDGGVAAGDPTKSILQEINDYAATNVSEEQLEDKIAELLTGDTAINNLVNALFAKFSFDISSLDTDIFDLLDDGDNTFSGKGANNDSTETAKYFLDFGNGDPAYIAQDLDDAFDRTLVFLESQHTGSTPWDADREVSNYTLGKFFQGSLLLDQGLIDAIIADQNIGTEELEGIRSQTAFLTKFETSRDFIDFVKTHYDLDDDQAAYRELFKHDLAARTPKYYEDKRSLVDMLRGKADANDHSSASFIFGSIHDKISQAAGGAVQALSGGFDKLATNNFEAFVRDNPITLIEHLLASRSSTTDSDQLKEINKKIVALKEFQTRQLDSFNSWFKEKNKELGKTKLIIDKLTEEYNDSSTSIARRAEIEDKISLLLTTAKENDGGLTIDKIRTRAATALTKLQELSAKAIADGDDSSKFDADIQLIQNTLSLSDNELIDSAIKNGSAIAINRAIAKDLADMSQSIHDINVKESSSAEIQAELDAVKLGFDKHEFLSLDDGSSISIDEDALDDAIDTVVRAPNTHVALYTSELLESGKINSRFISRKLPQANEDGTLPEDNQIAPPQISPTPASAALAAIGSKILNKANNVLHETSLPDENWVTDRTELLGDINSRIDADTSPGEVFFNELKTAFKDILQDVLNSHNGPRAAADDAKLIYRFTKNMDKDGTIGGDYNRTMTDIEAALDSLGGTTNAEDAADLIFLDNYRGENYFKSHGLGKIQNTLQTISSLPLASEVDEDYEGETIDLATRNRANALLNGTSSAANGNPRISISTLITHLEAEQARILAEIPSTITGSDEHRLHEYSQQLTKDFADGLINDPTIQSNFQTRLEETLTTTSFDLNNDGENDFQSIQNVIDGIDDIADQVTSVFGEKYDKAQRLTQLKNAINTRRSLETELNDTVNPPNAERAETIRKQLYGFETDPETKAITIGTADNLKSHSLISTIEDLKVDAANILDQSLPSNEDSLLELIDERKNDFAGIENQSIKRLILLMFVLSMLEYSDWDYRKQEADPSRYQVY